MGVLVMVLVLLAACVVQAGLPAMGFLGGAKWPVIPAVVLYYALRRGRGYSIAAAILAGVVVDSLSLAPAGGSLVSYILLSAVLWYVREWVDADSPVVQCALGGTMLFLVTLVSGWWLARRGMLAMTPWGVFGRAVGTGVLGCAAAPLVIAFAGRLDRAAGVKPGRIDVAGV